MRLKACHKKFKLLSIFLILLLIMFAFSSTVEGDSINEPVWAFPGAYVKYYEKNSAVTVFGNWTKHVYPNITSTLLYKILSVNLKNQTFSYLESGTVPPAVLLLFDFTQNVQNASLNNKFWNYTFNYSFGEYFNETTNINQPITIFFVNKKTLNELNKGFVPTNLSTVLSLDFWYSSKTENIYLPPYSKINVNTTDNLTLIISHEIFSVIKVQVNFYENFSSSFGNATAYIDKYSGIIVKWNNNLTVLGPLKLDYYYDNITIILNSTNIPMGASQQINYYFILALSIGVILIISVSIIYFKKKNK